MAIEAIVTDKAPAAVGPYSAATKAGNCIHVSGQLPVDPATGEFAGDDIASQTRQSLTNVKNVLEAAGATMADVAETTVLLDSIADFGAMNEVYAEFFAAPYPARAAFEVAALPKGAKVEIKAVAVGPRWHLAREHWGCVVWGATPFSSELQVLNRSRLIWVSRAGSRAAGVD